MDKYCFTCEEVTLWRPLYDKRSHCAAYSEGTEAEVEAEMQLNVCTECGESDEDD